MNLSPTAWSKTQSPVALMVIRILLLANAIVLAVAGGLFLVSVERPAGIVAAALRWGVAATLFWGVT